MKTQKVKAIFKGSDGSCGYQTDREYTLTIHHSANTMIHIENVMGGGWAQYSSIISFLKNWDNIRKL